MIVPAFADQLDGFNRATVLILVKNGDDFADNVLGREESMSDLHRDYRHGATGRP